MNYLYAMEVWHEGLAKRRVLRASDKLVLERMANAQLAEWEELYQRKLAKLAADEEREERRINKEVSLQIAREETEKAQHAIREVASILKATLVVNDAIDWNSLKDTRDFDISAPNEPILVDSPAKPIGTELRFLPKINIFDKIFARRAERKRIESEQRIRAAQNQWETECEVVAKQNEKLKQEYEAALNDWREKRKTFEDEQAEKNAIIEKHREQYRNCIPEAILEYCSLVLSRSKYPVEFPQDFDLDYDSSTKMIIVEYRLPSPDNLPTVKEVKYVQATDDFKSVEMSDRDRNKLYDSAIYQIALRTIHELFEADVIDVLDSVAFNGWVTFADKTSGAEKTACIVSVHVRKAEFMTINLARVGPRECFISLKGIAAAKLYGLSPVAPILQISREDKRFISSYPVAQTLDASMNIAAMDWEDFEHLIRELFEKEFSQSGGEVKITQASRDRGVDAVAFDPDPIRGGKIVIQAKRYTNVVGVAAVRDLYGTVINEGAMKGILITTSTYGPDAYEFSKGKPITLLTGGNLLHMLEKHGYHAKIDLMEAKQLIAEEKRRDHSNE